MPDACFVEDSAVVAGGIAAITRSGAEARRAETPSVAHALARFCRCVPMTEGLLDGGDVLIADGMALVGLSARTNEAGARELGAILGLRVRQIPVCKLLHLKTGVTRIGARRLMALARAFEREQFDGFDVVETDETAGATVLEVEGHAIVSAAAPKTAERLRSLGLRVHAVDIGEFHAGDAGVTCLSVIFSP